MAAKTRQKRDDTALVLALACGKGHAQAARQSGFSARTVARRMREPAFLERVSKARGRLLDDTLDRLKGICLDAAKTLKRLLGAEAESVRLGAAKSVIEISCKMTETIELQQRIEQLERRAGR